ncbi:hypothetical protein KFL_000580010 [Klebsormidium nitens]|uniref:Uncharacterized protein n=1 Tax=Klebsormidium nitens TaxID=105231 RepID=A0A1Y1HVP5_KLENI|nr:hypothetical protein KFL_000580010 [Klebsormidium nitens]|eukprot:GAQ80607.1 hypothetical protein KFL_000580010 [Klebsormidium nitens]
MADPRNVPNPLLQRAATYLIVPTILFILLSPGLLLEIPARHHFIGLTTHHTSWQAILVHAVVFLILNYLIFLAFLSADRRPGDENRPVFHDLSESTMIKALKYSIIPTIVFIILSPGQPAADDPRRAPPLDRVHELPHERGRGVRPRGRLLRLELRPLHLAHGARERARRDRAAAQAPRLNRWAIVLSRRGWLNGWDFRGTGIWPCQEHSECKGL